MCLQILLMVLEYLLAVPTDQAHGYEFALGW